jgi:hypothetical protein
MIVVQVAYAVAAPSSPSPLQVWVPAVLSAIATVAVGWLVYRSSRQANRTSDRATLAQQQLAWTQQAWTESQSAKLEAREAMAAAGVAESSARAASAAADSAARRADVAEQRLREVTTLTDSLVDWIARVVRKAHADGIDDRASPAVVELLRVINGGPPEITSDRLRRLHDHGG